MMRLRLFRRAMSMTEVQYLSAALLISSDALRNSTCSSGRQRHIEVPPSHTWSQSWRIHLLANVLHAHSLPHLHKVLPHCLDLFEVTSHLVVELGEPVCHPAALISDPHQGMQCMRLILAGRKTHQNLKVTPQRVSLFTLWAFMTPCMMGCLGGLRQSG